MTCLKDFNRDLYGVEIDEHTQKFIDQANEDIDIVLKNDDRLRNLISMFADKVEEVIKLKIEIQNYENNMAQEKAYKFLDARIKGQSSTIELLRSQLKEMAIWDNKRRTNLGANSYDVN